MLRHLETGEPVDLLPLLFGEDREGNDRPWMMYNMVASVDGATAVEGSATPLNDEDDKTLFRALRAVSDLILVGAETVRAEDYAPIRLDEEQLEARRAVGLDDLPRLVIATRSGDLDPSARLFSDEDNPPLIVTGTQVDVSQVEALEEVAEVAQLEDLSPASILDRLDDAEVILCEGGPSLNGQFFATGFVDEVNLTISPQIVSGRSARIAHGDPVKVPLGMKVDRRLVGEAAVFLRYLRD